MQDSEDCLSKNNVAAVNDLLVFTNDSDDEHDKVKTTHTETDDKKKDKEEKHTSVEASLKGLKLTGGSEEVEENTKKEEEEEKEERHANPFQAPKGLSSLLFDKDEERVDRQQSSQLININDTPKNGHKHTKRESKNIQKMHPKSITNTNTPMSGKVSIVEASKTVGGQGSASKYVLYTIKYGTDLVKRRYSDFELLRNILIKLFPTTLIPPIPKKQSLKSYSKSMTSNERYKKTHVPYLLPLSTTTDGNDDNNDIVAINVGIKDESMIRHRTKMLTIFLNRLLSMKEINETSIISDFLNPDHQYYVELINGLPSISNNLLSTPLLQLNPSNPLCTDMEIYNYLPIPHTKKRKSTGGSSSHTSSKTTFISDASKTIQQLYLSSSPSSSASLATPPTSDEDLATNQTNGSNINNDSTSQSTETQTYMDQHFNKYEHVLKNKIYKYNKKSIQHMKDIQMEYGLLSQSWGEFANIGSSYSSSANGKNNTATKSTKMDDDLIMTMVHTSNCLQKTHLNMEQLVGTLFYNVSEPLYELCGLSQSVKKLIEYRNLKRNQKNLVVQLIATKTQQLEKLRAKTLARVEEGTAESQPPIDESHENNSSAIPKQASYYGNKFFKKWNQLTNIVKETINYVEIDPHELIPKLEQEIIFLQKALNIAQKDLVEIERKINTVELPKFSKSMDQEIHQLLKIYARNMKESTMNNLEVWKSVRDGLKDK